MKIPFQKQNNSIYPQAYTLIIDPSAEKRANSNIFQKEKNDAVIIIYHSRDVNVNI